MKLPLILLLSVAMLTACKKDHAEPAPEPAPTPTPPTAVPCTYAVGAWSPWSLGVRTREVEASPAGCVGTPPASIDYHACHTGNKMFLRVSNYSSNPYRITITGPTAVPVFDLPGGYMRDSIMVSTGTYGLHSLQLSGYVLYPSEFNGTASSSTKCTVNAWSFP